MEFNGKTMTALFATGGASIDVTAKVGQTIVVKEVDENGKPTAWEAADMPTALQKVLLWDNATFHNSNQCADGAKVTVTEMDGEYSGVEVLFYCKRGGSLVSSGFIPKDTLNPNGAAVLGVTPNGELVTRTVRYSGNVFTFGAATIGTATDNAMLLPWRIYGYK